MTFLQLINKVLVKLRESTVSSNNESDYSTMIGVLVNEAKREVEDAWQWTALRTNKTVNTVASQYQAYSITDAGDRYHILKAWNDTDDVAMCIVPDEYIDRINLTSTPQTAGPIYYRMSGVDSNGDPKFDVFPTPDGVYTLNFRMVVPQDDLAADATVLSVPWRPVVQKAYSLALGERGEDGGIPFSEADKHYEKMLGDAIAQDAARVPHENNWCVE